MIHKLNCYGMNTRSCREFPVTIAKEMCPINCACPIERITFHMNLVNCLIKYQTSLQEQLKQDAGVDVPDVLHLHCVTFGKALKRQKVFHYAGRHIQLQTGQYIRSYISVRQVLPQRRLTVSSQLLVEV